MALIASTSVANLTSPWPVERPFSILISAYFTSPAKKPALWDVVAACTHTQTQSDLCCPDWLRAPHSLQLPRITVMAMTQSDWPTPLVYNLIEQRCWEAWGTVWEMTRVSQHTSHERKESGEKSGRLLLRSPAISLGFTIFGWDFCVCNRFLIQPLR